MPECLASAKLLRSVTISTLSDISLSVGSLVLDTGEMAIGTVLPQLGKEGTEHVIAGGIRCLDESECNCLYSY